MRFVAAVFLLVVVLAMPAIAERTNSDEGDGWGINVGGTFFVPLEETIAWMGEDATCLSGNQVFLLRDGRGYPVDKDKFFIVQALAPQEYFDLHGKRHSRFVSKPFVMISIRALADFFSYRVDLLDSLIIVSGNQKQKAFIARDYLQFHFNGLRGQGRFGDFVFPISGARKGFTTPRGWFEVFLKDKHHKSGTYQRPRGGAPMPLSLFFAQNVAYHVGKVGVGSHGCIHGRR